ncbi:hypothetical protein L0156_05780 [bacterium]|nr:hypothetical protein [bacterium]
MNIRELQKNIGKLFRIRPKVQRITVDGKDLPFEDDKWILEKDGQGKLFLQNTRTAHVFRLSGGNVKEFREPDFILLRAQLTLRGNAVDIEPIF